VADPFPQPDPHRRPAETVSWLVPAAPTVDDLTTLQRRLVYEVSGTLDSAAVLFCDHPTGITIGREGSRLQVRQTDAQLVARKMPVSFVPRGNGAMLHLPGQITCYPIIPLDKFGVSPGEYVRMLVRLTAAAVATADIPAEPSEPDVTVRVRGRRIAHFGVAVRNSVSLFGIIINVSPDLESFRDVDVDGDPVPMTSMQREMTSRVSPHTVRQKLLNALCDQFSLRRTLVPNRRPYSILNLTRHAFARRTG
jgi:lipoyl(octanoyl) transferase